MMYRITNYGSGLIVLASMGKPIKLVRQSHVTLTEEEYSELIQPISKMVNVEILES